MRLARALLLVSILIISSCNMDKKSKDAIAKEQVQHKSSKKANELILTETTFGKLKLEKGMPLKESKIKELFSDFSVLKKIGEQDGPNYYYYEIGRDVILETPNLENEIFSQLRINEKSKVSDKYGIKTGMTYSDIEEKRPNMSISTEHYHIYLFKEGSNIRYEMSLGNYSGPDKEEYSLEDLKSNNSKVISIVWK